MAQPVQTFKNHTRLLPPFHFFVIPVLLANALNAIRHVWLAPGLDTVFALAVATALVMLALLSRMMAITAQDRIIRLEMQLRLRECLPPDLRNRIAELTPKQLIALRFASDSEMPDLVRDVIAGKLSTQKEIKMRVRNWQADRLRV
jgi:hypothetical protein